MHDFPPSKLYTRTIPLYRKATNPLKHKSREFNTFLRRTLSNVPAERSCLSRRKNSIRRTNVGRTLFYVPTGHFYWKVPLTTDTAKKSIWFRVSLKTIRLSSYCMISWLDKICVVHFPWLDNNMNDKPCMHVNHRIQSVSKNSIYSYGQSEHFMWPIVG